MARRRISRDLRRVSNRILDDHPFDEDEKSRIKSKAVCSGSLTYAPSASSSCFSSGFDNPLALPWNLRGLQKISERLTHSTQPGAVFCPPIGASARDMMFNIPPAGGLCVDALQPLSGSTDPMRNQAELIDEEDPIAIPPVEDSIRFFA